MSFATPVLDPAADWEQVRALFPHVRERVYLDTAAAGLCWQGHGGAVARFYDEVKSRGYDARPEWLAMTQKVRGQLAAFLHTQAEAITFVSNTTEALNLAALSLRFAPGERIVLADDEFPSVARVWGAAERAGAEVVRVPVASEEGRQAALLAAIDERTRVLAVSQTQWSTGTTMDLAALGRHCRERGVLLMVDGIQAMGAVPTDLAHVDIYCASFFKWMLSGFGIGVLVTSERARAAMQPAFHGYANMDAPGQLQYAHVNMPGIYGLEATLDVLGAIGWTRIFERVQAVGGRLVEAAQRHGLSLVTPAGQRAGVIVIRCADGEAARVHLASRNISVSARGAGVRVSPHFYNSFDEVEQCAAALAQFENRR